MLMNKILGVYRDRLKGVSSAAVTSLSTDRVKSDIVVRCQHIAVYNGDALARDIDVSIQGRGYDHIVYHFDGVPAGEWQSKRLELYISEYEFLKFSFNSIAADKTMEVCLSGWLIDMT